MAESGAEVLRRYLGDAIAAESDFMAQLKEFVNSSEDHGLKSAFEQHHKQTEDQHKRLVARLEALGGKASGAKGLLSQLFGLNQKAGTKTGTTESLIAFYAVENSHLAMYEALASVAEAAGDTETIQLARSIQQEERAAAEKIWSLLQPAATGSFRSASATTARS